LQEYLKNGLSTGTPLWAIGSGIKWDDILGLLLLGLSDADRRVLMQVNSFCGWLRCGNGKLINQVDVQCGDAVGAEDFDRYVENLHTLLLLKLAQKWPRATALVKELAQTLKRTRKGELVVVNLEADTESIRQLWRRPGPGSRAAK
jgi:hypothetical protein